MRDEDGYFWYQARSDDMIISAGYNIAGPEVEVALLRHPDVSSAAWSASRPERTMARQGVRRAARRRRTVTEAKAQELQDTAKRIIAPYKLPRLVEFVDALPRTSTGKVQRYRAASRRSRRHVAAAVTPA